jgi:hypothetical protein
VAGGGTAVYVYDGFLMKNSCPFACSWDELLNLASVRATVKTNDLGKIVLKQFATRLSAEPDWCRHQQQGVESAGYVVDYGTTPPRRVFTHAAQSSVEGSKWKYTLPPKAQTWVLIRAYHREELWDEFKPWFLSNVGGSITSMPTAQRLSWVLDAAMKEMPGAFRQMCEEIRKNPGQLAAMALVVAAFAVAQALPPTRVFAMIFGLGADAADIVQAGKLFVQFSREMNNAYTSDDLDRAGKTCCQWLLHLALAVGLPIVGTVVGAAGKRAADKLQEWLVRRKVEEWREAMGEMPNPYGVPQSRKNAINLPDPKTQFSGQLNDIKALRRYYLNYIKRLEELAQHTKDPRKAKACRELIKAYQKRHKLLTESASETIGHIQAVIAGGQVLRKRVARWKGMLAKGRRDDVLGELKALGMKDDPAASVLDAIERVDEAALDFTRHDQDLGGPANRGKMSAYIASRLSLDATSLERLIKESDTIDGAFKKKDVLKLTPEEIEEVARQLNISTEAARAGKEVDEGRKGHNTTFAHHVPKQPADFFEYGIDTVHAMMQRRSYRPGGASLESVDIDKAHKPGDANLCLGMLILAKDTLKGLDEQWLRDPQSMLMNILD